MIQKKYNIYSATSVILSAANLLLLTIIYSKNNDLYVYLAAINLCTIIQLLSITPFEQFIHHYVKINVKSTSSASKLFSSALLGALLLSGLLLCITLILIDYIIEFTSPGLSGDMKIELNELMKALALSILLSSPLLIMQQKMNADKYIGQSFALSTLPMVVQFPTLIILYIEPAPIYYFAWALSFSYVAASVLGLIFCRGNITLFDREIVNEFKLMSVDGIKVRTAHNIYNLGMLYFLNSSTSQIQIDYATIILTIKRGSDALISVISGPLQRVLPRKLFEDIQITNASHITNSLAQIKQYTTKLYLSVAILLSAGLLSSQFFNHEYQYLSPYIAYVSMIYFIVSILISMEIPYSTIISIKGVSKAFYTTNIVAIAILLGLFAFTDHGSMTIYIPIYVLISQIWIYFSNMGWANKLIRA